MPKASVVVGQEHKWETGLPVRSACLGVQALSSTIYHHSLPAGGGVGKRRVPRVLQCPPQQLGRRAS